MQFHIHAQYWSIKKKKKKFSWSLSLSQHFKPNQISKWRKHVEFQNQNIKNEERRSTRHNRCHTCSRHHIHSFHHSKTYFQGREKNRAFLRKQIKMREAIKQTESSRKGVPVTKIYRWEWKWWVWISAVHVETILRWKSCSMINGPNLYPTFSTTYLSLYTVYCICTAMRLKDNSDNYSNI